MSEEAKLFSDYEGKAAVRLARNSIETYLRTGKTLNSSESHLPAIFNEARGVFVTLTKKGQLRGCIGYPYADVSLSHAIVDSALSAALRDPRFPPVTIDEMGNIYVELTILTRPEIMDVVPKDLPSSIKIGRHGLIVKSSHRQGLLLPQVAVENDFDEIEFLGHTCLKAGLPHDAWMMGVDVYSFEGQIFSEKEPGGEIVEKDISKKTCSND